MKTTALLSVLALALSTTNDAHAAEIVYALMPTQSSAGASTDAAFVSHMMRVTLQENGAPLVHPEPVAAAIAAHQASCAQSPVTCARLVGQETGATRLVGSELVVLAGALELRVFVVDLGVEAVRWRSYSATDHASLGEQAQRAVLEIVRPDANTGQLSVSMAPGAEIVVDGVFVERTPMLSPVSVSVGRHEVEVRTGRLVPWRAVVDVALGKLHTLTLCVRGDTVVQTCSDARPTSPGTASATTQQRPPRPLFVAGSVLAGIGLVGVVVGAVAAVIAGDVADAYAAGEVSGALRDAAVAGQTTSIAAFAVGATGLLGSAGTLVAATWSTEESSGTSIDQTAQ